MLVHVVQKRQLRVARISKLERVVGCGTWLSNMSDEELSIDEARSHSTEETRGMLNLTLPLIRTSIVRMDRYYRSVIYTR